VIGLADGWAPYYEIGPSPSRLEVGIGKPTQRPEQEQARGDGEIVAGEEQPEAGDAASRGERQQRRAHRIHPPPRLSDPHRPPHPAPPAARGGCRRGLSRRGGLDHHHRFPYDSGHQSEGSD
jgi:hypothetical protein